jgi:twitching motility two-component system response regulator PilG
MSKPPAAAAPAPRTLLGSGCRCWALLPYRNCAFAADAGRNRGWNEFRQGLCMWRRAGRAANSPRTYCGAQMPGRHRERKDTTLPEQNALSGVKVMVIDDSNTIRRSAEIFLLQAGCTVILAEDGFDALAKITDHQPDMIFVDIMMPRLDGYQTCALIKKNSKYNTTPVLMLSSKDGLFDRARGRMVGSDQYLTKPFTKEGLLKAVSAHVRPH